MNYKRSKEVKKTVLWVLGAVAGLAIGAVCYKLCKGKK